MILVQKTRLLVLATAVAPSHVRRRTGAGHRRADAAVVRVVDDVELDGITDRSAVGEVPVIRPLALLECSARVLLKGLT